MRALSLTPRLTLQMRQNDVVKITPDMYTKLAEMLDDSTFGMYKGQNFDLSIDIDQDDYLIGEEVAGKLNASGVVYEDQRGDAELFFTKLSLDLVDEDGDEVESNFSAEKFRNYLD